MLMTMASWPPENECPPTAATMSSVRKNRPRASTKALEAIEVSKSEYRIQVKPPPGAAFSRFEAVGNRARLPTRLAPWKAGSSGSLGARPPRRPWITPPRVGVKLVRQAAEALVAAGADPESGCVLIMFEPTTGRIVKWHREVGEFGVDDYWHVWYPEFGED